MANVRRVGIFCDPNHGNAMTHVLGLRSGFRDLGVEVSTGFMFLDGWRLARFIDQFRPDFIIEINRSRNQVADYGDDFPHIAWVQDCCPSGGKLIADGYGGSVINYSTMDPRAAGLNPDSGRWECLHAGIDPGLYHPLALPAAWDLSMIGQLWQPLTADDLQVPVASGGVETTVGEIQAAFLTAGIGHNNLDLTVLDRFLISFMGARNPEYQWDSAYYALLCLYAGRLARLDDRPRMLRAVLAATAKVAFFGTGSWQSYPDLSAHFAGEIYRASDENTVINASHLVFHSGNVLMHDRVLKAMAAGRATVFNRTPFDDGPYGIGRHFEPGEDFVFLGQDDIGEVVRALLADEPRRRRMGERARRRVLEAHTWRHRAQRILSDFSCR